MLHRFMVQEKMERLPADLDSYLAFVSKTLEDNKKNGGIAMKFEVAYFRPTTFGDPSKEEAADIYARFAERRHSHREGISYVFRITSFASSFSREGGCTCRCTFIPPLVSATTST